MKRGKRHGIFLCLFVSIFLLSAYGSVKAATLEEGSTPYKTWQEIKSDGFTITTSIVGMSNLSVLTAKGENQLFCGFPFLGFVFQDIPNGHTPMFDRTGKIIGGWTEVKGEKKYTPEGTTIDVKGMYEGVFIDAVIIRNGNTIKYVFKSKSVMPARDIAYPTFNSQITRSSPQENLFFKGETRAGRAVSGNLCKLFPTAENLKCLEVTKGSALIRFDFPDTPGMTLQNYGNPEKSNYPSVAELLLPYYKVIDQIKEPGKEFNYTFTITIKPVSSGN